MRIRTYTLTLKKHRLSETDVFVSSVHYRQIIRSLSRLRFGSPVLAVTGERGTVYRILKPSPTPVEVNACAIGSETQRILRVKQEELVDIKAVRNQAWGRYKFFKNHQNIWVRIAVRVVGLAILGWVSALIASFSGISIWNCPDGHSIYSLPWPMITRILKLKKEVGLSRLMRLRGTYL